MLLAVYSLNICSFLTDLLSYMQLQMDAIQNILTFFC